MKPCLSQTITLPSSFAEDVANYADAGCTALEVWLPKIEEHLAGVAADHRPFQLHLRGTGTFRPVTDVVFVAVAAGIAACEQLAADITSGPLSRPLLYPYHPHVTVAQDVSESALDAIYDGLTSFEARCQVDSFTLYEHGADGRWQPQRRFVLSGDQPH